MAPGGIANAFNQKMNSLRLEADENAKTAEDYKEKLKSSQQQVLDLENQNKSLTHRNGLLESEVEKLEQGVKEAKAMAGEGAMHGQQNEALTRRLQLLEEEAEQADKTLRETSDKYVQIGHHSLRSTDLGTRLRQTDVKAGHYERKVQALEKERDDWEAKFEEMAKKHSDLQKELQELEQSMGNI